MWVGKGAPKIGDTGAPPLGWGMADPLETSPSPNPAGFLAYGQIWIQPDVRH